MPAPAATSTAVGSLVASAPRLHSFSFPAPSLLVLESDSGAVEQWLHAQLWLMAGPSAFVWVGDDKCRMESLALAIKTDMVR